MANSSPTGATRNISMVLDALLGRARFPGHAQAVAGLAGVADREEVDAQVEARVLLDPLLVVGEAAAGDDDRLDRHLHLFAVVVDDDAGDPAALLEERDDRRAGQDRARPCSWPGRPGP